MAHTAKIFCSDAAVSDMLSQANRQYTNGEPAAALQLVTRAIACKPDVQLYRLAASFACAAHNQAAAEQYFRKIPDSLQPAIRKACQQANIDLAQ